MRRVRKGDSSKYHRRKKKRREARKVSIQRMRKAEAERARQARENQARFERIRREYLEQEQALVNVLARRLCQLDPEYAEQLRAREVIKQFREIASIFWHY